MKNFFYSTEKQMKSFIANNDGKVSIYVQLWKDHIESIFEDIEKCLRTRRFGGEDCIFSWRYNCSFGTYEKLLGMYEVSGFVVELDDYLIVTVS